MKRKNGGRLMLGGSLLALALTLAGCTSERDRIDAEAQRLCAIDGGVKVYETVTLPPEKFNEYGQAPIPIGKDDIGWGYYETLESKRLIGTPGEPTLVRDALYIIRTADQKRMGESIRYMTGGGEFLAGYIHYQSSICPQPDGKMLRQKVFIKGEK